MLVLTRKLNERICIGNNITIQIVDLKDGKVRLGINAPKDIPVHREEIYEKINGKGISTKS